jgi:hypothetical protein
LERPDQCPPKSVPLKDIGIRGQVKADGQKLYRPRCRPGTRRKRNSQDIEQRKKAQKSDKAEKNVIADKKYFSAFCFGRQSLSS